MEMTFWPCEAIVLMGYVKIQVKLVISSTLPTAEWTVDRLKSLLCIELKSFQK